MKRYFFLLWLLPVIHLPGQAQNLYGFVLEQNSGKKPVEGVRIKSTFGANQVTTAKKGDYTLTFQDARPGKSVVLAVEKDNWVITDKSSLEANLPEDPFHHPHTIILCRKEVWEQQNKDFKVLLENYIKKSYEKEKAALDKQDKRYQQVIDSLQDRFTSMEKDLTQLAELYSKTNLDELTDTERKAYILFRAGKIDECIALRKTLESEKNFLKAKGKEKQLDSLGKQIDTAKSLNQNELDLHRRNLTEEARLAQLKYDFKTAQEKLEFLAINDSADFDNVFNYGAFLQKQNQQDKAIFYYKKAFLLASTETTKALVNINLGALYYFRGKYPEAEMTYMAALESYKGITLDNPSQKFTFALSLNNLGLLYISEEKFQAAEKTLQDALNMLNELLKDYPGDADYEVEVAGTLVNLALLYEKDNYPAAEKTLLKALDINRRLAKENTGVYEHGLAETLTNLGTLYRHMNRPDDAEKQFQEALEIYRKRAKNNPATYDPLLASTLDKIGMVYEAKGDFPAAQKTYLDALDIWARLAQDSPMDYGDDMAITLTDLGLLYDNGGIFEAAEKSLLQSLDIYRFLAKEDAATYDSYVSDALNDLGQLYRKYHKNEVAEKVSLESLGIRKRLAKDDPVVYEPGVANTLSNLGALYYNIEKFGLAQKYLSDALDIYRKYFKVNLRKFDLQYAYTVTLMGYICVETILFDNVNKYLAESPVVDSVLASYPDVNEIKTLKRTLNEQVKTSETFKINMLRMKSEESSSYKEKINLSQQVVEIEKQLVAREEKKYVLDLANDKGGLAWYLLFDKQFAAAEKAANEALHPTFRQLPDDYANQTEWINTNLALALLFQGKYDQAQKIYLDLKDKPYGNATYKKTFLADLDELEKAGITHKDVKKIRAVLNQ